MTAGAKLLRALLALDLVALLLAISLATITAQGPAQRALGRSVAILTQVDTYLDEHLPALQQEAARSQQQRITLPDFPVAVSFTPLEIQQADRDQLRALLLRRAAGALHRDGMSAFRQDGSSEGSFLSPQGAIRAGMELLRPVPHWTFLGLAAILGLVALLLAQRLAQKSRGYAHFQTLGLITAGASSAFLVLAVGAWLALRLAGAVADDYLADEFLTLARQLTWAPVRDGLIALVGGLALTGAGAALTASSRQQT